MKTLVLASLIALPLAAQATAPPLVAEPTVGAAMNGPYQRVASQFIGAAEAMPEDKYDWAPTQGEYKGVKTFAQEVKHVSAVNYILASAILGEKPPVEVGNPEMGPDTLKTKASMVQYMKDSFAYAHKAMNSITAQNGTRFVKSPFGQGPDMTPIGIATILAFHSMDHYGQMVEYLRMNGIVPPASRR